MPSIPVFPNIYERFNSSRKVIVVPYFLDSRKQIILCIFQDAKTKEWTVISGGCKKNEKDVQSAHRELQEETYGAFCLPENYMSFSFFTNKCNFCKDYRKCIKDPEGKNMLHYSVFMYKIDSADYAMLKQIYFKNKYLNTQYKQETMDISTIPLFNCKKYCLEKNIIMWDFIRKIIFPLLRVFVFQKKII